MSRQTNEIVLISDISPLSLTTESFRALRASTKFTEAGKPVRIICVTSCNQGEGKSMTAANLAISYAQQGLRTLLIDADMRTPVLHKTFNVANRAGLSMFLTQSCTLDQVTHETRISHLSLITAGMTIANQIEMLSSPRMEGLLKEGLTHFDRIVLDTPPILQITDAQMIAVHCDGVVLVVKIAASKSAELQQAKNRLEQVKANILGVVINGKKRSAREKRYASTAEMN